MSIEEALRTRSITMQAALDIFDGLDVVEADSMRGGWRGSTFASGHRLDGALDAYHWHGKRFDSAEDVHPLVFRTVTDRIILLEPARIVWAIPLVMRFPVLKCSALARVVRMSLPLFATRRSRARLRMTSYRGRVTATMIYDSVPIIDVFRRVDTDTVLGLVDWKGMRQPFFFLLRREGTPQ